MRLFRQLFLIMGFVAAGASASVTAPQLGAEYQVLARPQPAEAGKKVEVIEFFGYFCPHCNILDPMLTQWVKKQGDNIVFKRIHVDFSESTLPQQKLFATLEAMGKLEELHSKVFYAMHVERKRLGSDAEVLDFAVKNGLDKQKFQDTYNSFSVRSKLGRSKQLQETFNITGVPTFAVEGRYITSPSIVGVTMGHPVTEPEQNAASLQVMDWLVAKVQKEKGGAAPAPAAAAASTSAAASAKKK
ncbi:thiol:disulfide interchange protein DsbA/DsbL [Undibacterium sp. TJN25]|uniref:thiol:disulfide interchange protein DsbA/DsbL n=1 Tax=Undibacterium sp. TJN25 TaxID=3413056 RepID=UPI003BF21983